MGEKNIQPKLDISSTELHKSLCTATIQNINRAPCLLSTLHFKAKPKEGICFDCGADTFFI